MPVYRFGCEKCGRVFKKMISLEDWKEQKPVLCKCEAVATHMPGAASSQAMEVLDDGIGVRRIERLSEAERIFKERDYAHRQLFPTPDDEE